MTHTTDPASDVLRPCPYCGTMPQGVIGIRDGMAVICGCGARVTAYSPNAEAKARSRWNTRTPPPPAEVDAELVEALEWYGEQARLCRLIHSEGDAGRNALSADGGKRARATLARLSPPSPEDVSDQPIYADLTAHELACGTYHPGDDA